jgi:tetratricopeptide (TPR) repeat protein
LGLNTLSWILVTCTNEQIRNIDEALVLAERAAELTQYRDPFILDTLATCYAAVGQFERALEMAEKALNLASADQNEELVNHIHKQMEIYKQKNP